MNRSAALVLCAALLWGCSGVDKSRVAGAKTPKLAAVKREALREFDAALRALRLGGPEADERAIERFQEAVRIDPTLWEGWHDLGVVLSRNGDDRAAHDAFQKALDVNPAHTPTLLARAEAARRLGRAASARKDYEAAIARDEKDAATRLRLASLLRESGDHAGALDAVRDALRYASDARAYVELGLIYLAQERMELAELVLSKAAKLDERSPLAWNALALLSLRRGEDQQAFERFDHATSLDPAFRDARFNKAAVLLDAGDFARALPELEAVVAQDPEDIDARVALGVAQRGLGEYDRAAATWESILKSAPRQPDALYDLAVLEMDFRRSEDPRAARDYLARYLQAAPEDHPRRKDAQARVSELGDNP
jgi:tetratricopeptide (TPR) repeat protein